MKDLVAVAFVALFLFGASGCSDRAGSADAYTLYRSSIVEGVGRIHVATFDSKDGENYNSENCELAASLFQRQPDVKTRFWCEKGKFKK